MAPTVHPKDGTKMYGTNMAGTDGTAIHGTNNAP
jgi:hypothetical protein